MKIDNVLPKLYKEINKLGYTNYKNFNAIDDINQNYLWFINLTWLSDEQIVHKELESFHNSKMIPFGITNGGDYWCFDLNQKGFLPIVCCYHDGGVGEYYAKTLEAALFRQILDFACNEFIDSEVSDEINIGKGKQIILNCMNKIGGYFPETWIFELNNIINSKAYTESSQGYVVMITESQYDELIKKYIDFDLFDNRFIWTENVEEFFK